MGKISTETKYMGLVLKTPFIAASCGLTFSEEHVKKMEAAGVGAIVVKSIFEEQIGIEAQEMMGETGGYMGTGDYFQHYAKEFSLNRFVETIKRLKEVTSIPVIASISCHTKGEWVTFAKRLEQSGADALELNIYYMQMSLNESSEEIEGHYFDIVDQITSQVSIPVGVKIGDHFTNLPAFIDKLRIHGAQSVVLFNRFYAPDINIDTMKMGSAEPLSHPHDYSKSLRWTAIVSALVKGIDIAASTGVHTADDAVKMILAGADAVQLCSILYKDGVDSIIRFVAGLQLFMEEKGYDKLSSFQGTFNYSNIEQPEAFERVQFLKARTKL